MNHLLPSSNKTVFFFFHNVKTSFNAQPPSYPSLFSKGPLRNYTIMKTFSSNGLSVAFLGFWKGRASLNQENINEKSRLIIQRVWSYFCEPVPRFWDNLVFCWQFWGIRSGCAVSGLSGGEELNGELNQAEVQVDVVSGSGITLQCRFLLLLESPSRAGFFYWITLKLILSLWVAFWKHLCPGLIRRWVRRRQRCTGSGAIEGTTTPRPLEKQLLTRTTGQSSIFWEPLVLIFEDHTTGCVLGGAGALDALIIFCPALLLFL